MLFTGIAGEQRDERKISTRRREADHMRSFLHVFGMIVHSLRKGDGSEEKEEKTKRDRERERRVWKMVDGASST